MSKEEKKLNPCVLCGGEGEILKEKEFYAAHCRNPDCRQHEYVTFDDEDAARAFWNEQNPSASGKGASA